MMYKGVVIEFTRESDTVFGQLLWADHYVCCVKLLGNPKVWYIPNWPYHYGRGMLQFLPLAEQDCVMPRKTVVVSVGNWLYPPNRWQIFRAWLGRGDFRPWRNKQHFLYFRHRKLVTGLLCIDGWMLPPAGWNGKHFHYFEQYNLLKKKYPELWNRISQSNLITS